MHPGNEAINYNMLRISDRCSSTTSMVVEPSTVRFGPGRHGIRVALTRMHSEELRRLSGRYVHTPAIGVRCSNGTSSRRAPGPHRRALWAARSWRGERIDIMTGVGFR